MNFLQGSIQLGKFKIPKIALLGLAGVVALVFVQRLRASGSNVTAGTPGGASLSPADLQNQIDAAAAQAVQSQILQQTAGGYGSPPVSESSQTIQDQWNSLTQLLAEDQAQIANLKAQLGNTAGGKIVPLGRHAPLPGPIPQDGVSSWPAIPATQLPSRLNSLSTPALTN